MEKLKWPPHPSYPSHCRISWWISLKYFPSSQSCNIPGLTTALPWRGKELTCSCRRDRWWRQEQRQAGSKYSQTPPPRQTGTETRWVEISAGGTSPYRVTLQWHLIDKVEPRQGVGNLTRSPMMKTILRTLKRFSLKAPIICCKLSRWR